MAQGPLISIVVPCLNEEAVIGEFVDWCKEGLRKAGASGEILIIDSSTDRSAEIAEQHGAQVLRFPQRGLGRAYIDAIPYIRGKYVIMGDCDLTYDFRDIRPFIDKLEEGSEFVMGTRMKGFIEPGAMPFLHRYFGTPFTTWILNFIYNSRYSDIHCGMRAMTLDALKRIDLQSQSWEYASEMIVKASQLRLRHTEVPIRFYKDQPGRFSHHKRSGWRSPWIAGWINLKAMFVHAPDFFLFKPGLVSMITGWLVAVTLAWGPYTLGPVTLSLHWMLLGVTLATIGYTAVQLAILARVYYNFNLSYTRKIRRWITYDRGMIFSGLILTLGFVLNSALLWQWITHDLRLLTLSHAGIFGLLLLIFGFQSFIFTLFFEIMTSKAAAEERRLTER